MQRNNPALIAGIALIAAFVAMGLSDIGETPSGDPYSWYLPILLFVTVGAPFLLGFIAGKEEAEARRRALEMEEELVKKEQQILQMKQNRKGEQ